MDKLNMKTPNIADENYKKLTELFPNAVTEVVTGYDDDGKAIVEKAIDKDILMQEINCKVVEGREERYQFIWPDKRKAILAANSPISKTLRPCREESIGRDGTKGGFDSENLYIEGDNLDVLKLLQETYLGKIKMIYIDPPYNTGNDFVYNDDFSESTQEYLEKSGQFDKDGNRLVQNTESNGRFHTDWLNMMYPRLKLARNLLTDDGVIFISIDDNEVDNLKKICNEVFGEGNFVDVLHWKRKKQPSFLAKHTAKVMEYVIVYAKNENELGKLSIETLSDATKKVVNLTNQKTERFFSKGVRVKCGTNGIIKKGVYKIKTMEIEYLSDVHYENGRTIEPVNVRALFSVSQDKIDSFIKNDLLFITVNMGLRRDVSLEEQNNQKSITDLLLDWGDNQDSEKELNSIFRTKVFDYSKPSLFIKNIIKSVTNKNGKSLDFPNPCDNPIILDFFSGSATTAHSVMQLNAEDGGKRKFIMVQLPELTDEKSEAFKAGYKNICEIGKERIRRAGEQILKQVQNDKNGVLGGKQLGCVPLGEGVADDATKRREPQQIADDGSRSDSRQERGGDFPLLDTGFRVLKLDSTNMKDVYYNPEDVTQNTLDGLADNIKRERTNEDLLFQVMLELGVPLSSKITEEKIGTVTVYNVGEENFLTATFDSGVTDEVVKQIAQKKPYYFVLRDSSMQSDAVAANFEQIFKTYSPTTKRKVL